MKTISNLSWIFVEYLRIECIIRCGFSLLRYCILVDKMTHMVGSYPPKMEIQSYVTPSEDAPAGVVARGSYTVQSLFTDDDENEHLKWEWSFDIKKDWK